MKKQTKIGLFCLIALLFASSMAFYVTPTKATATIHNGLWFTNTASILSDPTTFWNHFDASNLNYLIYELPAGWQYDGTIDWNISALSQPIPQASDANITAMIQAVRAHNATLKIGFASYGDDVVYYDMPNLFNSGVRTTMSQAITYGFTKFGWDFYIDDLEISNLTTVNEAALWWNLEAQTCAALGKQSAVYYGNHPYGFDYDANILSGLTTTFVIYRFNPIDSNPNNEQISYTTVVGNSSIPWGVQMRGTNASPYDKVSDFTAFLETKFTNGVPSNYYGATLWDYEYMTAGDWSAWQAFTFNTTVLPTPTPPTNTPTPTSTSNNPTPTPEIIEEITNQSYGPLNSMYFFVIFNLIIIAIICIAYVWLPILGVVGGVLGLFGTGFFWTAGALVVSQYTDLNGATHIGLMPIGFLALLPLVLAGISFITVVVNKK